MLAGICVRYFLLRTFKKKNTSINNHAEDDIYEIKIGIWIYYNVYYIYISDKSTYVNVNINQILGVCPTLVDILVLLVLYQIQ